MPTEKTRKKRRKKRPQPESSLPFPITDFKLGATNLATEEALLTQDLRQIKVAELVLKYDWPISAVARTLNISSRTVKRDLVRVRKTWGKRREDLITKWADQDLAKLRLLEREIWDRWNQEKDPKLLTLVLQCLAERRKIMTALQFKGDPVSRGAIQATYIQMLVKNGDLSPSRLRESGFDFKEGKIIDAEVIEEDNEP